MAETSKRNPGSKPAGKTANQRGAARLAAVQALYQMEVGHQSLEDTLSQFSAFHLGREIEGEQYLPADADFFRQIVAGVIKSQLEIDPAIVEVGPEWFDMHDPHLQVVVEDGRYALAHDTTRYSVVAIDAYRLRYIPWHLTTRVFFEIVRARWRQCLAEQ